MDTKYIDKAQCCSLDVTDMNDTYLKMDNILVTNKKKKNRE